MSKNTDNVRDEYEQQLRDMNAELLISSVRQQELAEEAKRALAALAASEEKYRTLFESIDQGFCVLELLFNESGEAYNYVFLEANAAFETQSGLVGAVGRSILDFVPGIEPQWAKVYAQVAKTGEPVRFDADVASMARIFDIYAFSGGGNKVAVVFNDITERKQREANLAFLAGVSTDLVSLTTIDKTMEALGAKIGTYFEASMCSFVEIDAERGIGVVTHAWHAEDAVSLVGEYRIADYGTAEQLASWRSGKPFVVMDAKSDKRVNAEALAPHGIASYISMPIARNGEWQYLLTVYDCVAHDWREDEIDLMRELTTRIWTRLERAHAEAKVKALSDYNRNVLESITDPFITLDREWRFTYISHEGEKMVLRQPGELLGKSLWDEFPGLIGSPFEKVYREAMDDGITGTVTDFFPDHDRWYEVRVYPSPDGVTVSFRNLTESKRAEETLRRSEENFRALANSISQLAWMTDADGGIFWYNERWFEYTGTTLEEVQGWGWQTVHHPDEVDRVVEKFKRYIASGEPWEDTFPLRSKTGEYRLFLSRARPIKDENGNIVRWFGTNTDIDDVRLAEESVRKSEEDFRALADASPGLIWRLDADGCLTYVNRRFLNFYGVTKKKVFGDDWQPPIHPDDADPYIAAVTAARLNRQPLKAGARVRDRVGAWAWIESHARPIFDSAKNYAGHVGISLDLTELKLMELDLRRSAEELETRVAERTAQLAEKNEELLEESEQRLTVERDRIRLLNQVVTTQEDERRRIARDLHDALGQQMTALRLKLESAKDICDEEAVCNVIDETQAIAENLDADIGFLAWELRPASLHVSGLVVTLNEYVNEWSRFSSIAALFHSKGFEKARLSADAEINLYRIVQEALNNVTKYAKAKNVSVLFEEHRYDVSLIIEDDGIGFNPESEVNEKSGLGLIGMSERAALLGGKLNIESSKAGGTTIFVRVPTSTGPKGRRKPETTK